MSERRLLINVASLKKSSIVVGDEVVDVDGSEETPLSTSTNSSLLVPFVDKKRLICLLLLLCRFTRTVFCGNSKNQRSELFYLSTSQL